jgi:hypothetical protein
MGCGCKKKKNEMVVKEVNTPKMSITVNEVKNTQQAQVSSSQEVKETEQKVREFNG